MKDSTFMFCKQSSRQPLSVLASLVFVLVFARSAAAQPVSAPEDRNPGDLTVTGSFDVVSTYMFRGIRQHSTGIALWPVADLGAAVYEGDGAVKSAGINLESGTACTPGIPAPTVRRGNCGTSRISTRR
jgi:hypothetical protein